MRRSPLITLGVPDGIRTRVAAVKGRTKFEVTVKYGCTPKTKELSTLTNQVKSALKESAKPKK
jgi:hypothetical protein